MFPFSALSQQPKILVTGKVIDASTQEAIPYATISVKDFETEELITGAVSDIDGLFEVSTTSGNFFIEISYIGYTPQNFTGISIVNNTADLGTVELQSNTESLGDIYVTAERSSVEYQLDKRVFNVGQDIANSGVGALEVLNNVPSVNVNIEGEVSLRGSTGVQILINGKPSVLTSDEANALGTITADMIESVEVITNPSAKYDAEGTAGIINLIIKKEDRKGTNGSISVNGGLPDNYSVGVSLNRRSEHVNFFTQMGAGYSEMPDELSVINSNFVTDTTIYSNGTEYRNERYFDFIMGMDYYINPLNVITLTGNYTLELENQPSYSSYLIEDAADGIRLGYDREESTEATNPKYQFDLQYSREFSDNEDHTLQMSATGSSFAKDQSSYFQDITTSGSVDLYSQQQTATNFQEGQYTFKLDYAKPINAFYSIEAGSQYYINDVSNDYEVQDYENGIWVIDASQTNVFDYNQKVLAFYTTAAYEGNLWGLKLGLRVEDTDLTTLLANSSETNHQKYTDLFPTVHTSYNLAENLSLQGGYSRRIFRPRLWDLNPFMNIRNTYSIRTGNPDLLPEMTDSYEVGTVYNNNSLSLSTAIYHRYTTDVIERIATLQNNVNISTPDNIGTNKATGLEVNAKYDPVRWMSLNADFNYNYFNREGTFENEVFDFTSDQWTSRLTSKFKLPADFDVEVTGNYRSSRQTVQSTISDMLFADLGVRKKIMNGKGVINLSVRDVFASRIEESFVYETDYSLYNEGLRGRFITLGFSFGFGKGEAMTYGGQMK